MDPITQTIKTLSRGLNKMITHRRRPNLLVIGCGSNNWNQNWSEYGKTKQSFKFSVTFTTRHWSVSGIKLSRWVCWDLMKAARRRRLKLDKLTLSSFWPLALATYCTSTKKHLVANHSGSAKSQRVDGAIFSSNGRAGNTSNLFHQSHNNWV